MIFSQPDDENDEIRLIPIRGRSSCHPHVHHGLSDEEDDECNEQMRENNFKDDVEESPPRRRGRPRRNVLDEQELRAPPRTQPNREEPVEDGHRVLPKRNRRVDYVAL